MQTIDLTDDQRRTLVEVLSAEESRLRESSVPLVELAEKAAILTRLAGVSCGAPLTGTDRHSLVVALERHRDEALENVTAGEALEGLGGYGVMATATETIIELDVDYRREIVAHMLAEKIGTAAEELEGNDLNDGVAVDTLAVRGFHAGVDPFLDHVASIGTAVDALRQVADETNAILTWPFTGAELLRRAESCVGHLHESLDHTPTDKLVVHAEITREARAFVAELRDDQAGGDA